MVIATKMHDFLKEIVPFYGFVYVSNKNVLELFSILKED